MTKPHNTPFFIGWAKPPAALWLYLLASAVIFLVTFAGAAYLTAATQADPGDGTFRWDWGQQAIVGTLQAKPYPHIHVTESGRVPAGTTVLLSGLGKRGVQARAGPLDGAQVAASGIFLTRGSLTMMQVRGGADGLSAAADAEPDAATAVNRPAATKLGRWKLTGEICDGKCYGGAMRPGRGLAHKACANLCLAGGAPPVFVSTGAVDGETFFLLGAADGGPLGTEILDQTATLITVEGDVERRGSIAVLLIDPATIALAR